MEKLHSYQGWGGRLHEWRDDIKVRYANWREEHPETLIELVKKTAREQVVASANDPNDYSHIYRYLILIVNHIRFSQKRTL